MITRAKLAIGGTLAGIALLTATVAPLPAQDTPAAGGTPAAGETGMMQGADAVISDAEMTEMMEQCLAMMKMMSMMMGMMGGDDMAGMEGMEGMEDMAGMAATPEP